MVTTRGVKFKFEEGERVLCFEPDTTKAKVLYDSKVLGLNIVRDNRGCKVAEYLIHFSGWSSNWDRCVKEDFILPVTEENRILQNRLANEAAASLKGKRKCKLPLGIKESPAKNEKGLNPSKDEPVKAKSSNSASESDSSDDENEKVDISIPKALYHVLYEDKQYITQKNKVIKLPCEPNVISVLEGFLKHLAIQLMSASPTKNTPKSSKEFPARSVESKINSAKEVMDGVRVYFDFTLQHLLLYRQEKTQYHTIGNTCIPASKTKLDLQKAIKKEGLDPCVAISPTVVLYKEPSKGLHSQYTSKAVPHRHSSGQKSQPGKTDEVADIPAKLRSRQQPHKNVESGSRSKTGKMVGSRRSLRSGDKPKSTEEVASSSTNTEQDLDCIMLPQPESPPSSPPTQSRQTRRSNVFSQTPQPTSAQVVPKTPRLPPPSQKSRNLNPSALVNQPVVTMQPLSAMSISNFSSSASSTHSSLYSPREDEKPLTPQTKMLGLRKNIEDWKLVPDHCYDQIPAPPSLIYGAHHLLRLFVNLPELLRKTDMPRSKMDLLLKTLNSFLEYLSERKERFFLPSMYVDSCIDTSDGGNNSTSV